MKRQLVSSSNLSSVGYDERSEILEVEFKNGSIFHYDGVPKSTFHGLVSSNSVGKFFHSNIRNQFTHSKER